MRISLSLLAFALCSFTAGCTATMAKQVAKVSLDVSNAVCDELAADLQDEPSYVKFTCQAIGVADGLSHVFLAKVRKEDAGHFAARHCPKPKPVDGQVSP
jgi:hypothetical protein